ncbi:hypothetical protein FQR65_LT09122 [Abscondita terminalis]|nr:hypothetical protein FQR65_LT09122 [Abscondita terminalis]
MSWTRDQVQLLIESYRRNECLYEVKNPLYKNRHAREAALTEIQNELIHIRPKTTIPDIKSKFNALRQNFLKEHRNYKRSVKSGAGNDDLQKPNIWYYDLLLFLLKHCEIRKGTENISVDIERSEAYCDSDIIEEFNEDDNVIIEYIPETPTTPISMASTSKSDVNECVDEPRTKTSYSNNKVKKTTNYMEVAAESIKSISNTFHAKNSKSVEESAEDTFGKFVASKLKMITDQSLKNLVEAKICQLLYENVV